MSTHSDELLRLLVDCHNRFEISLSLTLNVGGLLITGDLIGLQQYRDGIAEELASSGEAGRIFIEVFQAPLQDADTENEYIHLKNAHLLTANAAQVPSDRGVFWRGKLSAVDGFVIGRTRLNIVPNASR